MSNQADADLNTLGAQADAGADQEARESAVSSTSTIPPAEAAELESGVPGRDTELDEEQLAIDEWQAQVAQLQSMGEIDDLPDDLAFESPGDDLGGEHSEASPQPPQTEEQTEEERARQFRLRPRSKVDELAFELMKADPYLSGEEAFERAKQQLSDSDDEDQGDDIDDGDELATYGAPSVSGDFKSSDEVAARIRQLRRDALQAQEVYDLEEKSRIEREILDLEETLVVMRETERHRAEQAARENEQWVAAAKASMAAVQAQYPIARDQSSPFFLRMKEIDEAWQEAGDPRWRQADKAETIATIVAKEFGVRPVSAPRQYPSTSKPIVSRPATPGAGLSPASGGARTHAPDTSSMLAAIDSIDDPTKWQEIVEQLQT